MDKERLTALGLAALAVLYLAVGWPLKAGDLASTGPGFIPRLVGLALLAAAAVNLARAFHRPAPAAGPAEAVAGPQRLAVAGLAVSVFAFPLLLPWLNFTLTTCLVTWGMLLSLRYKTVLVSLGLAVLLAVACFLAFGLLLDVSLPAGPLEELLYRLRG